MEREKIFFASALAFVLAAIIIAGCVQPLQRNSGESASARPTASLQASVQAGAAAPEAGKESGSLSSRLSILDDELSKAAREFNACGESAEECVKSFCGKLALISSEAKTLSADLSAVISPKLQEDGYKGYLIADKIREYCENPQPLDQAKELAGYISSWRLQTYVDLEMEGRNEFEPPAGEEQIVFSFDDSGGSKSKNLTVKLPPAYAVLSKTQELNSSSEGISFNDFFETSFSPRVLKDGKENFVQVEVKMIKAPPHDAAFVTRATLQAGGLQKTFLLETVFQKKLFLLAPRGKYESRLRGSVRVEWETRDKALENAAFVVEYSRDAGASWKKLGETKEHFFNWDTTRDADSREYLVRVKAVVGGKTFSDESEKEFEVANIVNEVQGGDCLNKKICVFDDHQWSLYWWYAKGFAGKKATLIHVDTHDDIESSISYSPDKTHYSLLLRKNLDSVHAFLDAYAGCATFIVPAFSDDTVARYYWISPWQGTPVKTEFYAYKTNQETGEVTEPNTQRLFSSERPASGWNYVELVENIKATDDYWLSLIDLEKPVLLDIDMDYFACERPTESHCPANETELVQEIQALLGTLKKAGVKPDFITVARSFSASKPAYAFTPERWAAIIEKDLLPELEKTFGK